MQRGSEAAAAAAEATRYLSCANQQPAVQRNLTKDELPVGIDLLLPMWLPMNATASSMGRSAPDDVPRPAPQVPRYTSNSIKINFNRGAVVHVLPFKSAALKAGGISGISWWTRRGFMNSNGSNGHVTTCREAAPLSIACPCWPTS
jgi:hypothetical protein